MADEKQPMSPIDVASKALTVISLGIAVFAAWKALPLDEEIKRLQAQAQALDISLKKAEADLKAIESNRKLTLELYQEVKKVIEKKDKDFREEDAVRVLVESLADDPFRWKLLDVLAVGATDADVKQDAKAASAFYKESFVTQAKSNAVTTNTPSEAATSYGTFNIDFFYCEKKRATSEPLARAAQSLQEKGQTGRWRVRELPETVNLQPGYGILSSEIRFTPPEERVVAESLSKVLLAKNIKVALHETSYPTPGYISVFVCE